MLAYLEYFPLSVANAVDLLHHVHHHDAGAHKLCETDQHQILVESEDVRVEYQPLLSPLKNQSIACNKISITYDSNVGGELIEYRFSEPGLECFEVACEVGLDDDRSDLGAYLLRPLLLDEVRV